MNQQAMSSVEELRIAPVVGSYTSKPRISATYCLAAASTRRPFSPSWTTGLSDIARHKVPMLRGQPNLFRVQLRVPHATQNLGPLVQIHLPPAFAPASRDAV